MRWGLVPSWAKDISISSRLINGRSETLLQKPAFKESFRNRRCLIPSDGFYEWKKTGKRNAAISLWMKDDSLFAFAGIWELLEITDWSSAGILLDSDYGAQRIACRRARSDAGDPTSATLPSSADRSRLGGRETV